MDAVPTRFSRAVCPIVVGREGELSVVHDALDSAVEGRGATLALSGEAGVGKSRLAREAVTDAARRSMTTLVGRGVPQALSPYRALTEALSPLARRGLLLDAPELYPFRHALGAILPDWRTGEPGVEEPPVIVGEGLLRLTRRVGAATGTLLVVEDLHWTDPETLAVVEYLADNLAGEPTVVLVTLRDDEPSGASELMTRVQARGAARILPLSRLNAEDVAAMAAACAGGKALPEEVVEAVADRSEGLPLVVEELLSVPGSGVSDAVPDSFADAVRRRLAALPAPSVLVIQCAALLGRRFDWRLLPSVTGLDQGDVQRGLEDGVAVQLLAAETDTAGTLRFRHALTREAVVRGLLPPTRVALAQRAAAALGGGGVDDDRAALAAELWVAASDREAAVGLLLTAGRGATGRGALVVAERLLERARALHVESEDLRTEIAEALAETLALAGKLDVARTVGAEALAALGPTDASASRRARLHLALARGADAATQWGLARQHLDQARHLAHEVGDEAFLGAVDALAAHVAMGDRRYDDAESLARRAAGAADRFDLPEVACEAHEVLGRRERLHNLDSARAEFERVHDLARRHGLALWSIRALHELGTIEMFERSSPERLLQASDLAYRAGALSLAATVDLQLEGLYAFRFEVDRALEVGRRAVEVARPLGLGEVHAAALLQLGFIHAIAGDATSLEAAVEAGLRVAGGNPESLAIAWGHARATYSLLAEDRARAAEQLDVAMGWARQAPGVSGVFPALWVLLRVLDGAGREVVEQFAELEAPAIPMNRAVVRLAEAVIAGREGEAREAEALLGAADAALQLKASEGVRHLARRLVAEAAIADGWGDPVGWLSEAMAFFERSGHERVAAACRDLLRQAGRRVSRTTSPDLPQSLRAAGVTSREADVLRLVGERLSNREIAERLYLSPRTVEKHVERLLQKTGAETRVDLGRIARRAFVAAERT